MISIEKIKSLIKDDRIKWSNHIDQDAARGIRVKDILYCVSGGEIIEYYPDDYPFQVASFWVIQMPEQEFMWFVHWGKTTYG